MRSAIRGTPLTVLLVLALSCAGAGNLNEHGLRVIATPEEFERSVFGHPDKELVNLADFVPGVVLDLRYGTENNFLKTRLYPVAYAWLRLPAALALRDIQRDLAKRGLGLKVYDAYRPYSVTVKMWEAVHNPDYTADPAQGSRHNRGAAVDVTLVTLRDGREVEMPTAFDDFTERASHSFMDLPEEAVKNRALLRRIMEDHHFQSLESEWWHYDFFGWQRYELLDLTIEELRASF